MYAKHRAMFRKQGLDVQLKILTEPTQTVATLLAGDADFVAHARRRCCLAQVRRGPHQSRGRGCDPRSEEGELRLSSPLRGKAIAGARDLVGKTIAIDFPFTIAVLGVRKEPFSRRAASIGWRA